MLSNLIKFKDSGRQNQIWTQGCLSCLSSRLLPCHCHSTHWRPQWHTAVRYVAYHSRSFWSWALTFLFRVIFHSSLLCVLHSSQTESLFLPIFVPLTKLFVPRSLSSVLKHVSNNTSSWNQFALYRNNDSPPHFSHHFISSSYMAFITSLLGIIVHVLIYHFYWNEIQAQWRVLFVSLSHLAQEGRWVV